MVLLNSLARRFSAMVLALVLFAGVLVLGAPVANATTHTVEMTSLLKFSPDVVTAAPGDTIVWQNNAGLPHNVVFATGGKFDDAKVKELGKLLGKGSVELTLPKDLAAGTYDYSCTPHRGAGMAGKIVVQ